MMISSRYQTHMCSSETTSQSAQMQTKTFASQWTTLKCLTASNRTVTPMKSENSPPKQPAAPALRQPPKPQMNSSSSQSSLASMTGIVDLGNKRRSAVGQPSPGTDLRNDPARTNFVASKPVNAQAVVKDHIASKTFDDNIIKPNLLANNTK